MNAIMLSGLLYDAVSLIINCINSLNTTFIKNNCYSLQNNSSIKRSSSSSIYLVVVPISIGVAVGYISSHRRIRAFHVRLWATVLSAVAYLGGVTATAPWERTFFLVVG
jgi:hypothetical protein